MDAATEFGAVEYPESDEMGDPYVHTVIAELLRPMIERWLNMSGEVSTVGANQIFYWVEGDPKRCRAPDVYVVPVAPRPEPQMRVWKLWEDPAPSFALEIASTRWKKDYEEAPKDYARMGVRELVVFDPGATPRSRKRVRWQVFRRRPGHGLARVSASMGDRVESTVLGCWLRAVPLRDSVRLRIGTGEHGDVLLPTDAERADAELVLRQIAESQNEAERRARHAAERRIREQDAARAAAEAEVARLRDEIERLRACK